MYNNIFSTSLSLTPWINFNDGARAQMSYSQSRQVLPLFLGECPLILTGSEPLIINTFRKSPVNGKVLFVHNKFILIESYDSGSEKYIIYKLSRFDIPVVKKDQIIKKGELLCVPEDFANDFSISEQYLLTYGINAYTSIINHPLGFEDAYVISKSLAEKFTSYVPKLFTLTLSNEEYLLNTPDEIENLKGKKVPKNTPVLKLMNNKLEKRTVEFSYDIIVDEIEIIPNQKIPVDALPVYKGLLAHELTKKQIIIEEISNLVNYDQSVIFNISVILGMEGANANREKDWSSVIKIYYKELHENIDIGDKITNRHAGKGVVSKIFEDNELIFNIPDNLHSELYLNPMSIISRMNVGTLYELVATRVVHWFNKLIQHMSDDVNVSLDEIYNTINSFYYILYKDTKLYAKFKELLNELFSKFEKDEQQLRKMLKKITFPIVVRPFTNINYKLLNDLAFIFLPVVGIDSFRSLTFIDQKGSYLPRKEYEEIKKKIAQDYNVEVICYYIDKNFREEILEKYNFEYVLHPFLSIGILPHNKKQIAVNSGWLYYTKLLHLVDYKISARSIGKISPKYLQPIKHKKGGHFYNSIEGGEINIAETLTMDNDNLEMTFENPELFFEEDTDIVGFGLSSTQYSQAQRIGEMESIALLSYDVPTILKYFMTVYSDDLVGKLQTIMQLLFWTDTPKDVISSDTGAHELIRSHLKLFGIDDF